MEKHRNELDNKGDAVDDHKQHGDRFECQPSAIGGVTWERNTKAMSFFDSVCVLKIASFFINNIFKKQYKNDYK